MSDDEDDDPSVTLYDTRDEADKQIRESILEDGLDAESYHLIRVGDVYSVSEDTKITYTKQK